MGDILNCKKYKVIAGRLLTCADNGTEFFSISRKNGLDITEADAMAHYIEDVLNERKDFKKYYEKYMRT